VGLDASHNDVCRFNPDVEEDQNVLEMVMANLHDLYKTALKGRGELLSLPAPPTHVLQAEYVAAACNLDLEARFTRLAQG
jgi:hypothetical protein